MLFYHNDRDLSLAVHGHDFTFCGADLELRWVTQQMQEWYDNKVRATLGRGAEDDKEVVILGRTVRWCHWGISWEADSRRNKQSYIRMMNGKRNMHQEVKQLSSEEQ